MNRCGIALALSFALMGAAGLAVGTHVVAPKGQTADWVKQAELPAYAAQKVIYHVDFGGGLLNRRYKHLLQVARNHVEAVGKDQLDLRIVMQGDGADLLAFARSDAAARKTIDDLKLRGVRFLICRNTLVVRGLDPDRDLYDVAHEDLVRAAVGEIAALESQGFRYMKPGG